MTTRAERREKEVEQANARVAENTRMRLASGRVTSSDPLVLMLYLLGRDSVPIGRVEEVITHLRESEPEIVYTNGWLARWAEDAADRLRALL